MRSRIFYRSTIFSKKAIFLETMGKKVWADMTIFKKKGSSYTKNEYNLFYRKRDAKNYYIKQFFSKKAVFSEETAKNCSGGAFDHFSGKGGF